MLELGKDLLHPLQAGVEVVVRVAVVGEHEIALVVNVAAVFQGLVHRLRGLERLAQVLHHRQGEDVVQAAGQERQGVHVGHQVGVGVQGDVQADDGRIVQPHIAAAHVDGDLVVQQRLQDHPVHPGIIIALHDQLVLVLDFRDVPAGEQHGDAVDNRVVLPTLGAAQTVALTFHVHFAQRAG
ncbi:MAG: hypothetical protein P8074_22680 [Anaerolineales bacterium]